MYSQCEGHITISQECAGLSVPNVIWLLGAAVHWVPLFRRCCMLGVMISWYQNDTVFYENFLILSTYLCGLEFGLDIGLDSGASLLVLLLLLKVFLFSFIKCHVKGRHPC